MTLDELKKEAKAHSYHLIPVQPYIKLLPCKCGRKRLEQLWRFEGGTYFACPNCGKIAPDGRNEREARKNWNALMEVDDGT